MTLQIFTKEKNDVQKAVADKIGEMFSKWNSKPLLFLSSGGSVIPLLNLVDSKTLNKNITLGLMDERYTSNQKNSNFSQITETQFYKKAQNAGTHFIDPRPKTGEKLEQFGKKFEKNIIDWMTKNKNAKIIATLGMGEDGHTAGILPHPENPNLFENNRMSLAYQTNKSPRRERVTVTFPFLREKIDEAVMFVSGENKKAALSETLAPSGTLPETPARIIHEMKSVSLFTDIQI